MANDAFVSVDAAHEMAWLYDGWPRYTADPLRTEWADTKAPLLMLNGTLDPQTPMSIASVAGEVFSGRHQTFVSIPNAAHATIIQSPTTDGDTCGLKLSESFLNDPTQTVDTTCLSELQDVDFDGIEAYNEYLFGQPDLWENASSKGGWSAEGIEPPGLTRVKRSLRRSLSSRPLPF